jgi:signal transduction histidine kinase/CheY-like chemotaxis protein
MERLNRNGKLNAFEAQFRTKSGEIRSVNLSIDAIVLDGVECTLTTGSDVTETRSLERQLHQSLKMEALGQLTGGIAHDFNNLLGVVVGNLDLLERMVAWNEAAVKRVQTALRAAGRGAELTRRLLAFSRKEQLNPAPVPMQDAIREVVELAARTIGPEIKITTHCDTGLPPVFVDAAGLETALLNLALNARDAMPKGGALIIRAQLADLTDGYALVKAGELEPGKFARITVCDSGHGMPREVADRAFEPFFTTKAREKGTGLGLAMVYGFVKQSGGAIRIYSEVGFGTTVSIYLPLAGKQDVVIPEPVNQRGAEMLGGTALLVDDEADLLDIADAYLADLGYTVIRAGNGAEALEALARAGEIDLMVTDIIMPGNMNGIELAQKVRELRPGIKVIYTSGFPAEALAERSGKLEGGPLLHKPYQRAEFADMVRKQVSAGSN